MKTMEEKRDQIALQYVKYCQDNMHPVHGINEEYCKAHFKEGWDACAKQYEEINILLKELQLAVVATDQLI